MALLHAIGTFQTGTYAVTRVTAGGYGSDGKALAGTTSTFNVDGATMPLTGRDLMVLPEAQRAEQTKWFYTATELRPVTPTTEPDVITIGSEPWVVVSAEDWNFRGELFWRCRIARRVQP